MEYKIHKTPQGDFVIQKDNYQFFPESGNVKYNIFLRDIEEHGIDIVEGPDVFEPSYAELRIEEYPSREDQLDMMYWDKINGTTIWEDTIKAIKEKYPKTLTGGKTIGDIPAWVQEAVDALPPLPPPAQEPEPEPEPEPEENE